MFFQSAERDLAIAQIPKCGITSFREWLSDFDLIPNDRVCVSKRVAFIRHPLERIKSAYSYMYWIQHRGGRLPDSRITTESWESFVDWALENDNEHWRPQIEFVGDVPNIWHRFENLDLYWERYKPGILGHENRASRLDTSEYREADLRAMYSDDLRLWEQAT